MKFNVIRILQIWDSESNESSNKQIRNKAWEELCRTFFDNFDGY